MSYDSSMMYTMGTALSRALEENARVAVLVDGLWLEGDVVLYDGTGVVLDGGDEHSVIKVERVTAVKVLNGLPWQREITEREAPLAPSFGDAMPMPGPRSPGA